MVQSALFLSCSWSLVLDRRLLARKLCDPQVPATWTESCCCVHVPAQSLPKACSGRALAGPVWTCRFAPACLLGTCSVHYCMSVDAACLLPQLACLLAEGTVVAASCAFQGGRKAATAGSDWPRHADGLGSTPQGLCSTVRPTTTTHKVLTSARWPTNHPIAALSCLRLSIYPKP